MLAQIPNKLFLHSIYSYRVGVKKRKKDWKKFLRLRKLVNQINGKKIINLRNLSHQEGKSSKVKSLLSKVVDPVPKMNKLTPKETEYLPKSGRFITTMVI